MITLRFTFPTGHYHATAWGSHVNEGQPEWPPSPWRVLRALIATWYHKLQHEAAEATLISLIESLCETAPKYRLPEASSGHSRHYMPLGTLNKEGYPDTTKVLDSFVLLGGHDGQSRQTIHARSLDLTWAVDLPPAEVALLAKLTENLGYLGRAESLVFCSLLPSDQPIELPANCYLLEPNTDADTPSGRRQESIRLLAPETRQAYLSWKTGYVEALQSPASGKKLSKSKLAQLSPPESLFEALLAETNDLRKTGWSRPPGSRWLTYLRPHRALTPKPRGARKAKRPRITVAQFAVSGAVLPSFRYTLTLGQRIHGALSEFSYRNPIFTGKNETAAPLEGHPHAYIFPQPNKKTGLIDRVTIYAKDGFDDEAQRAFDRLQANGLDRKISSKAGSGQQRSTRAANELSWVISYKGHVEELSGIDDPEHHNLFALSQRWVSLTPFVKTRHTKRRNNGKPKLDESGEAIGSAAHDLKRLLQLQDHPTPQTISIQSCTVGDRQFYWQQFDRIRKGRGAHADNKGYGYELTFPHPILGPLAAGYAAHFGLGLFVPLED